MRLPRASGFLVTAFDIGVVTRWGAVFCFLAGTVSSVGSGNGPSDLKTMVRGVEVDPVFWELPREVTLRQLAGRLQVHLLCFS